MLLLEDFGGLDTFVGRGDLDQDAGLVNALLLVELLWLLDNAAHQSSGAKRTSMM